MFDLDIYNAIYFDSLVSMRQSSKLLKFSTRVDKLNSFSSCLKLIYLDTTKCEIDHSLLKN